MSADAATASVSSTYLELSEEGGGSHKFYEVVRAGTEVTVTFGRIGEPGQTRTTTYPDVRKAEAEAAKKIGAKVRKGYAPAVRGVRKRRPVTRREIVSRRSTAEQAPLLWRFRSGAAAFGIFVDDDHVWVGNQAGDVFTLAHDGRVTGRFGLPDGVKCIVADDFWIYAGCDDGRVYDLSGKVPHVAYEIAEDVDIFWLDIHDGVLGVSDARGGVTTVDHEDEFQWRRTGSGTHAWMVRCDDEGVYHGDSHGVAMYGARDGAPRWSAATHGQVLFGWQEPGEVFAGTSRGVVHRLAKADGSERARYRCDAAVFSCATSPDGRYVFAGDNCSSVYCFTADGTRLWKLATGCGSAYSMQYRDERLYLVTTDGSLACIDATETAVRQARAGQRPDTADIKATGWQRVEPAPVVETVAAADAMNAVSTVHVTGAGAGAGAGGVIVECYQEGARTRVRVLTPGYDPAWHVQFPKDIRVAGARYLVTELHPATRGAFYRTRGDIKRLR
ncbi:WGR domain-containing protein [Actinacidiphila acididurans]|uniref:WGR domain-containing protein n=1 Tax=Actinacidiphila acididurans TaxID=2784346 RepID=A0ABS2TT29_9ACTN|nr:WGR domain-containing protein [Actinacidiphila acididurans]MBM9506488.1 WGR domain-containing protein [Actinacidiphila acididurans]